MGEPALDNRPGTRHRPADPYTLVAMAVAVTANAVLVKGFKGRIQDARLVLPAPERRPTQAGKIFPGTKADSSFLCPGGTDVDNHRFNDDGKNRYPVMEKKSLLVVPQDLGYRLWVT